MKRKKREEKEQQQEEEEEEGDQQQEEDEEVEKEKVGTSSIVESQDEMVNQFTTEDLADFVFLGVDEIKKDMNQSKKDDPKKKRVAAFMKDR